MRRILVALIGILLCCSLIFGDVAENGSGTAFVTTAAGAVQADVSTFTVDNPCANCCLIAILHTQGTITPTAVVWDQGGTNQAMTLGLTSNAVANETRIYYLVNPALGNLALRATWTTGRLATLGVVAFSGADQSTCINVANNATNSGSSVADPSIVVTSTATGATVGAVTNNVNNTATTAGTSIYRSTAFAAAYVLANPGNTHSWTASASGTWTTAGVHILAAGAAPTCRPSTRLLLGVGGC
jgi:hypothetical protein